jgi:alpha,alpha-trehalose phosphorylase
MHVRGDAFTPEQKARNFAYYEALTVRDSSLSACTQAVIAAEVGHLDLAYDCLGEAALMDLNDLEHNTRDGLHIAALAGTWIAAVQGIGGMRELGGRLSFRPRRPPPLTRLTFRLTFRDRRLAVSVEPTHATYTLLDGLALAISHYDHELALDPALPQQHAIPPVPTREPPYQPPGRAPRRRARPDGSDPSRCWPALRSS